MHNYNNRGKFQTSAAAEEGSQAHEQLEAALKETKPPEDEHVLVAYEYVQEELELLRALFDHVHLDLETWSNLSHLKIKGMGGGTADVTIRAYNSKKQLAYLEVIDYKHGKGHFVTEVNNPQLRMYGLGIANKIESIAPDMKVLLTIIQPRAWQGEDEPVRQEEILYKDLLAWQKKELIPAAKKAMGKNPPYNATEENCRWCGHKPECDALKDLTLKLAKADFEAADSMTPEDRIEVLEAAKVLPSYFEAVEEKVRDDMMHGSKDYQTHFKLVRKATQRRWSNEAEEVLEKILGEEAYNRKLKGLGDIEKLLKANEESGVMSEITWKPTGELVIAPNADRRTAVIPAETDFEEIE